MKNRKKLMLLLTIAVILSICVCASALVLTPQGRGGSSSSGNVTKTRTGEPQMNITSITGMTADYFNCRIRLADGTAATPNYMFTSTGSKSMYYFNADVKIVGASYFVRVQTAANETNAVVPIGLTWAP